MFAKELKSIFAFLLFSITLMAVMLFLRNGNTMIVTMSTLDNTQLNPKIYYANANEGFSEARTLIASETHNGNYYFHLPSLNIIKQLRFDPTSSVKNITLSSIHIITYNWFKKYIYTLDTKAFKPANQIEDFAQKQQKISFKTTGNDPQLRTPFKLLEVAKSHPFPLYYLIISGLISIILLYLIGLYRTQKIDEYLSAKLIFYALALAFASFKVTYYKDHVKFGYPPDETMHLKYVQYVHNHHAIVPNFKEMNHYLSHPSLYYELIDTAYDKEASLKQNVDNFRSLSILIYLTAFILILYLGFQMRISLLGHFVYLSIISSIPMHAYLGSSITNDTLAMLGGIIFILGLKRVIEENYTPLTYFILGLGIFIAFFSKLTAALLLFFAIMFFLVRMVYTKKWIKLSKGNIVLLLLFLFPILYYQATIMIEYHSLVPTYNHTHPEAYLKSGFYVAPENRLHLSPMQWFERMLHYIHGGWFGIHSHHSIGKEHWSGYLGLLILHIFAIISLFFGCKHEENKSYCLIGKITLLSLFAVLVVQYIFSYNAHVSNGYLGGLQPRYLLPFMFSFAIMASLFIERFKTLFIFNIFVILLCIHALYSDFFYFLTYYA